MSTLIQRSLASGELSPSLHKRVDLQKYLSGLKTQRNCVTKKGGGAMNRGGTTYVYGASAIQEPGPYDDAGAPIGATTILIPWESASSSDSYVMEFGDGFIRFTRNGAMVTVDTVSDWSIATAYTIGDLANYEGTNYYCIVAHTGQTPPNATYWYALSGYEYSIPTPYTTSLLLDRGAFSFVQDSDRMLITHSSLLPRELVRVSETEWTLTAWDVDASSPTRYGIPRVAAPTNFAHSGGSGATEYWAVTAITEDLEESLPAFASGAAANSGAAATFTWTVSTFVGNATGTIKGYNIYKRYQGIYFYQSFSATNSFSDNASIVPSPDDDSPPETRIELNTTAGTFPKKCGVFEGRTLLGNFSFNIQAIYGSKIGFRQNFTRRFPSADDDSLLFQIKGKQINGIRHFVDIGELLTFTDSGAWFIEGNSNGVLTPGNIFPKQYSYNGASGEVWPIVIGSSAIYVQERGSIVRAIGFDSLSGGKNGFRDDDLTAFAEHLFENRTIVSMSYQKTPHSIVWAVLDNGELLGMTYIREQEILAWHHHDTDGVIEDVCCIPEGSQHAVYLIVKRNINGTDVRYMERMNDRDFTDIVDAVFLDCSFSFDGRNSSATHTMTLSGGTDWDHDETLTITSSAIFFSDLEVGNEIWITGTDDIEYRFEITDCSSDYVVSVTPVQDVPLTSGLRDTATADWSRAVDQLANLDHLEDKEVAIFADGYVVANPNNEDYGTAITVVNGALSSALSQCHAVIHVGLPYYSDLETLDIDTAGGETLTDKKKCISKVTLSVQNTRGVWAGSKPPTDDDTDPLEGLAELKIREEENYATPVNLATQDAEVIIQPEWNSNGRVFIRQIDPLPMTILAIAPAGLIPFRGNA